MKYIMKFWKKWAARRIVRLMKSNHLKKEKAESHLLGEHGLWMVLLRSSSPAFCVPCSPNPCILQQGLLQFAVLLCMLYVLQDIFCPGPLGLFCLPLWQSRWFMPQSPSASRKPLCAGVEGSVGWFPPACGPFCQGWVCTGCWPGWGTARAQTLLPSSLTLCISWKGIHHPLPAAG